jgi:hypothetical protein
MSNDETKAVNEMFKKTLEEEPEPLECCWICGKELFDGDEAAGITLGSLMADYWGFGSDSEPWEYVMCHKCYSERFIEVMSHIEEVLMFLKLAEKI